MLVRVIYYIAQIISNNHDTIQSVSFLVHVLFQASNITSSLVFVLCMVLEIYYTMQHAKIMKSYLYYHPLCLNLLKCKFITINKAPCQINAFSCMLYDEHYGINEKGSFINRLKFRLHNNYFKSLPIRMLLWASNENKQ